MQNPETYMHLLYNVYYQKSTAHREKDLILEGAFTFPKNLQDWSRLKTWSKKHMNYVASIF